MESYIEHAREKIRAIEDNPYPMPDAWNEVNGYLLLSIAEDIQALLTSEPVNMPTEQELDEFIDAEKPPGLTVIQEIHQEMEKKLQK